MNILIIEDSVLISSRLKDLLLENTNSDIVLVANELNEAIELINNSKPEIILLDIEMQENLSSRFISDINKTNPDTILIALSTRRRNQQLMLKKLNGIDYLFDKYDDFEKILELINNIEKK